MVKLESCADFFANVEPESLHRVLLGLLWDGALEYAPDDDTVKGWLAVILARPDKAAMIKSIEEIHDYLNHGSP